MQKKLVWRGQKLLLSDACQILVLKRSKVVCRRRAHKKTSETAKSGYLATRTKTVILKPSKVVSKPCVKIVVLGSKVCKWCVQNLASKRSAAVKIKPLCWPGYYNPGGSPTTITHHCYHPGGSSVYILPEVMSYTSSAHRSTRDRNIIPGMQLANVTDLSILSNSPTTSALWFWAISFPFTVPAPLFFVIFRVFHSFSSLFQLLGVILYTQKSRFFPSICFGWNTTNVGGGVATHLHQWQWPPRNGATSVPDFRPNSPQIGQPIARFSTKFSTQIG